MATFQRILVPVDFSSTSGEALRYAAELAEVFQSQLLLLYVVPDLTTIMPDAVMPLPTAPPDMSEMLESSKAALAKLVREKNLTEKNPRLDVRVGSAASEILDAAKEDKVDLIVIGTTGRTGVSRFFLGSVAEKVVRQAPCPVLTVHGKDTHS